MGSFSNTNGELDLGCFTSSNIICGMTSPVAAIKNDCIYDVDAGPTDDMALVWIKHPDFVYLLLIVIMSFQ